MKRIIALFICMASLCSISSCGLTKNEVTNNAMSQFEELLTDTETTELIETANTTYPPATVPSVDTTSKNETGTVEIPVVIADPFEKFMLFDEDRGYFWGKMEYNPDGRYSATPQLLFFRVVGIDENHTSSTFTRYKIQFVDIYGFDKNELDMETVYPMSYRGLLDEQLYGRPPLELGKIYARIFTFDNIDQIIDRVLFQAGLVLPVVENEGKRYLYGYGIDFSNMECKIPILDSEENSIYKTGKHDKTIEYLQSINQELPTFDYKCEAAVFYEEIVRRSHENK